ncbi:MAG: SIMPL domain-containing protein [Mangrovibacterium sp.]
MKRILLCLVILVSALVVHAQSEVNMLEVPYVAVTGESYREIIPDEITVRFTLAERYEGKTKLELKELETSLLKKLKSADFDLNTLSVLDAGLTYTPIKRKTEDVLATKTYRIKLSTTSELSRLWEVLDGVQVQQAEISSLDLSNKEEVKSEVRKEAVRNAHRKAEEMLEVLGGSIEAVLFLEEEYIYPRTYQAKNMSYALAESADMSAANSVEFEKIKIECRVRARFSVKQKKNWSIGM